MTRFHTCSGALLLTLGLIPTFGSAAFAQSAECTDITQCSAALGSGPQSSGYGPIVIPSGYGCAVSPNISMTGINPFSNPNHFWYFDALGSSGINSFVFAQGGYGVTYSGPGYSDPELNFKLVHFNYPTFKITVTGTRSDGSTGFLEDSIGLTLNQLKLTFSNAIPQGTFFSVSLPLAPNQTISSITITPLGYELGLGEICVGDPGSGDPEPEPYTKSY